ncbi:MAG: hypothetical protein ABIO88_09390 [Burkholderiaceae bacterium]
MKLLVSTLALTSALWLSGCASGPAAPAWEANARSALDTTVQNYLTGNARAEEQDYARAYKELAATGRADLLARAELTRCAARVASLVFDDCPAFKPLAADAGAEQRAYADYLAGRWQGLNGALLPKHHAAVQASPANPAVLLQIQDPLSRLVAAGAMLQQGALRPEALAEVAAIATATASEQAWRRPLLAWLGLQAKQAETRGDTAQANSLNRRIALILSTPSLKP